MEIPVSMRSTKSCQYCGKRGSQIALSFLKDVGHENGYQKLPQLTRTTNASKEIRGQAGLEGKRFAMTSRTQVQV